MNKIANKFLLAGDNFMSEMYLKQPGFIYSAGGPFPQNKDRIHKFKEVGEKKIYLRKRVRQRLFAT